MNVRENSLKGSANNVGLWTWMRSAAGKNTWKSLPVEYPVVAGFFLVAAWVAVLDRLVVRRLVGDRAMLGMTCLNVSWMKIARRLITASLRDFFFRLLWFGNCRFSCRFGFCPAGFGEVWLSAMPLFSQAIFQRLFL